MSKDRLAALRVAAYRARGLGQIRTIPDALLLARMIAFGSCVPLLLRLPLDRMATVLTRPPAAVSIEPGAIDRQERLLALAVRVAHPLVRTGCLTRGLTLYWFLRRAGLDVDLRFGIDPGEQAAGDAHCWLTLDGEPINEKRDPRVHYLETYRLPRERPAR